MLVRQTSETWVAAPQGRSSRVPVGADALWLSVARRLPRPARPLGLRSRTRPVSMQSILAWDHLAPMGRDQYVVVVYPGYLFPFGYRCALVKVTERKMKSTPPTRSPVSTSGCSSCPASAPQDVRRAATAVHPGHRAPLVTPPIDSRLPRDPRPSVTSAAAVLAARSAAATSCGPSTTSDHDGRSRQPARR